MPGPYQNLMALPFHISGAGFGSTGLKAARLCVPFAHNVVGATASVGTAPAATLKLDVLHGANGAAPATSLWNKSNGSALGNTTNITYAPAGPGLTEVTVTCANASQLVVGNRVQLSAVTGITGVPTTPVWVASTTAGGFTFITTAALTGNYASGGNVSWADNRPTITNPSPDQGSISSGYSEVHPLGTQPTTSAGAPAETMVPILNEMPFLAPVDPNPSPLGFAGNQPVNAGGGPVQVQPGEPATPNWPQVATNYGYNGSPGDVYQLSVVTADATAADLILTLYAEAL